MEKEHLWEQEYVQRDLIRLQRKYQKKGYELTVEQCYEVWTKYSSDEFSNWLETNDGFIDNSLPYVKKVLESSISN